MSAEIYKIEVPDYGNDEINRMAVAYEAFRGMEAKAQVRCVRWLAERIKADILADKLRKFPLHRTESKVQRIKPSGVLPDGEQRDGQGAEV
jgi:predicted Mrr-cat superfamily restriction endonuclease